MDNASRILTYVVIFLLFQLAGPPALSNEQLKAAGKFLDSVQAELNTLHNVTAHDFAHSRLPLSALNFTNVREFSSKRRQQLHPPALDAAIHDLWNHSDSEGAGVYKHPNAEISGHVSFGASLPAIELPLPIFEHEHSPEWNSVERPTKGYFSLHLGDAKPFQSGPAQVVTGHISFLPETRDDDSDLPQNALAVRGVYLSSGRFIVSTSSLKYAGPAVIPYLLESDDARVAMLAFLNDSSPSAEDVSTAWQILEAQKSRALEQPEFVVYGQAQIDRNSSGPLSRGDLDRIEKELDAPQGAPLPKIPRLLCNAVVWSPDSGANGLIDNAGGVRSEVLTMRRRLVLLMLLGVYLALLVLVGQVSITIASPSRAGKLSIWTAAAMSLMDGTICLLQAASYDESTTQVNMALALVTFVLTVWFELDLVTRVYSAQANESALRIAPEEAPLIAETTPRGAVAAGDSVDTAAGETADPLPATAATPTAPSTTTTAPTTTATTTTPITATATPVRPTVEYIGERDISGRVYGRFYLGLFCLFISGLIFCRSQTSRYRYEAVVLAVFYSYWVPQSWRSVSRGSQVPLSIEIMAAISALRLAPVLYLCLVKNNAFDHHYRPYLASCLALWQAAQLSMLYLQRRLGPRFFLPRSWVVESYDYHRLLTDDIERQDNALPTPRTSGGDAPGLVFNENLQSYSRVFSCAICMEDVSLPIHSGGSVTPALEAERQKYMLTPCRHAFHTECLEQWMESKLQCPVCRSPLPAI